MSRVQFRGRCDTPVSQGGYLLKPKGALNPAQGKDAAAIEVVRVWYEEYAKLISYLTTLSTGLLVFIATYIFRDAITTGSNARPLIQQVAPLLQSGWYCLIAATAFGVLTRYVTYCWLAAGLSGHAQSHLGRHRVDNFDAYMNPDSMKAWGIASKFCGIAFSLTLAASLMLLVLVTKGAFTFVMSAG